MTATFSGIWDSLGAPVKDVRWSWCALSPDGKRAVFTLWQDHFDGRRDPEADPREREWVEGNELLELRIERDQDGVPWAHIIGRRRRR